MKLRPTLVALGLGIVTAGAAVSAGADADVGRGRVAAYTCQGCHGVPNYKNAYPNYSVPKLGGQNAQYLASALEAYAAGERPHPTMHAQAVPLSPEARGDIAAYFASEVVQPGTQVVGTPPPAAQVCTTCHGAGGAKPLQPDYPILAGQHADYIVHALKDYKSGRRKNPIMAGIIAGVDEREFAALAQFFAQQPGLCGTDEIMKHGKCRGR